MTQRPGQPDFRTLFEASPGLYLVLDPGLRIVAVTEAYLRATKTRRADILGRGIFDVFPDNPQDPGAGGVGILEASLRRVLRHGAEDVMAVQKYDIPLPESEGGGFEARFWSPFNSPVLAPDGSVAFIIHRVEDVTAFIRLKSAGIAPQPVATIVGDRVSQLEADIYARAHEVAEARNLLEQRVAERTAALEAANHTLEESRQSALKLLDDAVLARENAEKALARSQELLGHLHLLDQITRSIGERIDLSGIFRVVIDAIEQRMPLGFACVCLKDPESNVLRIAQVGASAAGLQTELAPDDAAALLVGSTALSRCMAGYLVYEADLRAAPSGLPRQLSRHGLQSLVLAPLRSESRVFGILVAARRDARAFSSSDCEFLRQLGEHVALAAQQAQLYSALQVAYEELRQTQQVAMQQERLRALGQMASGIAHDINNALSPATLYTEALLETETGMSDQARRYLEIIQRAVDDVAHTVARMREFYSRRESQISLAPLELNRLVVQVLDLTRARWSDMQQLHGAVIDVATDLDPSVPAIAGVESEIREALTNLVFNAVDAMPEGGRLLLRSCRQDGDAAAVILEVVDTGVGMDDNTRQRCLEPFFTTKGERGTGLGLAMVFGIVKRHGAEIQIESAPNAGTTVRLVFALPRQQTGTTPEGLVATGRPEPLRLLIIDDDPVLLKCLRHALESDGHVVVGSNGGEAGILAFQGALAAAQPFSAVITDLGMPNVDGRRVAEAIRRLSQGTPVILLTGWGQRIVDEGDVPPGIDRVLAKPPRLRDLRVVLAELCGSRPAGATSA